MATALPRLAVRPLAVEDLPRILVIEGESFPHPWSETFFLDELARGEVTRALVVVEDGEVCGYAFAYLVEDELHINNLAVAPERRGMGVGSFLLEALLGEAVKGGAKSATLEVRSGNEAARSLYHRLGFKTAGLRRRYYQNGEDALILSRDLP